MRFSYLLLLSFQITNDKGKMPFVHSQIQWHKVQWPYRYIWFLALNKLLADEACMKVWHQEVGQELKAQIQRNAFPFNKITNSFQYDYKHYNNSSQYYNNAFQNYCKMQVAMQYLLRIDKWVKFSHKSHSSFTTEIFDMRVLLKR